MTVILDTGIGNVGSVRNMLVRLNAPAVISADPAVVRAADRLILPGVGNFDAGMAALESRALLPALEIAVRERRVPILGICLGMQLLGDASEEGRKPGLGWIAGSARRFEFPDEPKRRVPHIGWKDVSFPRGAPAALPETAPRFYFVHSYHLQCERPEDVWMTADYGGPFTAAVRSGNVMGVQFHPEKSHVFGMWLLRHFLEVQGGPA